MFDGFSNRETNLGDRASASVSSVMERSSRLLARDETTNGTRMGIGNEKVGGAVPLLPLSPSFPVPAPAKKSDFRGFHPPRNEVKNFWEQNDVCANCVELDPPKEHSGQQKFSRGHIRKASCSVNQT